ncbi:MAG: hypothetical protein MI724_06380, partial [Spirochaetales bacterium]|nr:hypothetical protein [Spirochaetales bacterium]
MSIKARERIEEDVRLFMRREIAHAEGQEILFVGHVDRRTMVYAAEVYARGGESMVAAPTEFCERGDIIIHNHPSGVLRPSEADVAVSARLAEMGIASAIVDNDVEDLYVLVEPFPVDELAPLDIERLAGALEDGGEVAHLLDGFRERPSQVAMTRQIAAAFNDSGVAVAEAGTGVGKSFAYLVPAVAWAAQNRERVVIATATINLQQQLVDRDVPTVQRALGTDVTVALVKGRGNYLCRRRLREQLEEFGDGENLFEEGEAVRAVAEWADTSPTGSRNDLPFHLPEEQWGRVASEADTCAVSRCPNREKCFILRARRRAAGAQILVANHHLVFSDLAVRRAGAGWDATAILPPFQRLIFDEAHNLERAATSFFSESVSYWGLVRQAGRLLRKRGARRFGLLDRLSAIVAEHGALERAEAALNRMRSAAEDLNKALGAFLAAETTWRLTDATAGVLRSGAGDALFDARGALIDLASRLAEIASSVEERFREESLFFELGAYIRRLEAMASAIERFARAEPDDEMVLWMERRLDGRRNAYVTLHATPL